MTFLEGGMERMKDKVSTYMDEGKYRGRNQVSLGLKHEIFRKRINEN